MNPFEMVVIIVLISVGAGVINNWIKVRANREAETASGEEMRRVIGEVERLQERVRVLEKIVTDNDRQLAEQIRKLA